MKIKKITLMMLFYIFSIMSCSGPDYYDQGKNDLNQQLFKNAKESFYLVENDHEKYDSAQYFIMYIDEIFRKQAREQEIKDSIERMAYIKSTLDEALSKIKNFNSDSYYDLQGMAQAIQAFKDLGTIASMYENSDDQEISSKAKKIRPALVALQKKAFPVFRKKYTSILNDKLWEENISVKCFGTGNSTLQFIGFIYSNNKNIKDSQTAISESVKMFRFKRVNYKWSEYDDTYTYYSISSSKDDFLE